MSANLDNTPLSYHLNDSPTLEAKYRGPGYALGAVMGLQVQQERFVNRGQLVDFVYLADALPDFEPARLDAAIDDDRLGPTVRRLSVLGVVVVGMWADRLFTGV
jgi:hypothetical protein